MAIAPLGGGAERRLTGGDPQMTAPKPKRRRSLAKALLVLLVGLSIGGVFWFGLLPRMLNPLPMLSLETPGQWLVDFRLAALRRDVAGCARLIKSPLITAQPIDDNVMENGCGWHNAVRLSAAGETALPVGTLTCEMAAALTLWVTHDVQPRAERLLGSRVTRIEHMGGYACRNIIGSKTLQAFRSQHATANAIDISGFKLASGKVVRVARDWKGEDAESQFLREVHDAACSYFRIALGPDFNAAHHDHFHFDRGSFIRCR
jgi:hypothetical protein